LLFTELPNVAKFENGKEPTNFSTHNANEYCELWIKKYFLTEEEEIDEVGADDHANASEKDHHDEVGRAISERILLQHPAILVGEDHVEEEVEAERTEEEKRCEQAPNLKNKLSSIVITLTYISFVNIAWE
jgi:hypothetical protein